MVLAAAFYMFQLQQEVTAALAVTIELIDRYAHMTAEVVVARCGLPPAPAPG